MNRKLIIVLGITIVLIIVVISTWHRSSLQKAVEKQYLYLMDTEKNTISQISNEKYIPGEIFWTNDDKYFTFTDINSQNTTDSANSSKPNYTIIYSLPDLKCTKVIEDDNFKLSNYIDTNLFVKENKKIWDLRDVSEEVWGKIKSYIGVNFVEVHINYHRDKVIYVTPAPDFNVYIMDIESGAARLLTRGFDLKWSPDETKIIYYTHKYYKFDQLNGKESGKAEDYYTYMYDLNTGKSIKIADFGTTVFFSDDDRYLVFYKGTVRIPGFPGEI